MDGGIILEFQSTHPVWGATQSPLWLSVRERISIHAPRVGCDSGSKVNVTNHSKISIHAPRVGCDKGVFLLPPLTSRISIHAPRVGCDGITRPAWGTIREFQSTHPVWGATVKRDIGQVGICNFNPRTPCGVRRVVPFKDTDIPDFNPRTPCGVRRVMTRMLRCIDTNFNPRTPCGVRLRCCANSVISSIISIHAPRVGCDEDDLSALQTRYISIHAPRVGCDG